MATPTNNDVSLLDAPIATHLGVAWRVLPQLRRLGITTIRQLLLHLPHRYEDFSLTVPIGALGPDQTATVRGTVTSVKNIRTFRRRMNLTEAVVEDDSGAIKAVWFHQPFIARRLAKGTLVSLSGKVSADQSSMYLSNPAYEIVRGDEASAPAPSVHTGRLVPVYPETSGLSSKWLRFLMQKAFKKVGDVPEVLPPEVIERQKLLTLGDALKKAHFPDRLAEAARAKRRLAFNEIFFIQLGALAERMRLAQEEAPPVPFDLEAVKAFVGTLPFSLTVAQRRAAWEILQDIAKPTPMNRLLEGDVGSGKTVVAAIAIWTCLRKGYQAAVMAPTEILARQHFATLHKFLPEARIGLCVSSERSDSEGSRMKRLEFADAVRQGRIGVVVGTHALIQKDVTFDKLALAIVDEQHRFGVDQRAALMKKADRGESADDKTESRELKPPIPHLLSMTATPIPRTLTLTLYGDLDLSILDELPKGRQKIVTRVIPPALRDQTYAFMRAQVREGRQVFVVCPRIEGEKTIEGDLPQATLVSAAKRPAAQTLFDNRALAWADAKAVLDEYEKLSKRVFPDLRVAMLHGKMKPKEKEAVMEKFLQRQHDMLVSTSVIEVGVDVPNATIMAIEGAEHFGLAQLHQFRGRVGRGAHQSHCFLFTDSPAKVANRRLNAIVTAASGFALAEEDLRIRGPGDFHGVRQAGLPDLAMASLYNLEFITAARREAEALLRRDPQLARHPALRRELEEFRQRIHFE
ncbi:MAG: ATP-dependent DNA helicase RecG [bacterium]|nr:ATP-dependent DNA helicase RecG [bacterium]MDZ4295773.1 ATP-dependent DNA helicase RecG [Patescibacteria group bacterium]